MNILTWFFRRKSDTKNLTFGSTVRTKYGEGVVINGSIGVRLTKPSNAGRVIANNGGCFTIPLEGIEPV